MVISALVHLGIFGLLSTSAAAAPLHSGSIAARHEEFSTTEAQDKHFHKPIHPLPVTPLPFPSKDWPGILEPPLPIKELPVPMAVGRRDSDLPALPVDQDKTQHSLSTAEKDATSSNGISPTEGFSAFVEEIHHPAKGIYHRQVVPSTSTHTEDDTTTLDNDDVLKQSLVSPEQAKANSVVVHKPKHDVFRRWKRPGKGDHDEDQSSDGFGVDLVVHRPTHHVYRRAALTAPTAEVVDHESKLDSMYHWEHGLVKHPHVGETKNHVDESKWEAAEKRETYPIPPPEYFEEETEPESSTPSSEQLSRRHSASNDQHKDHPHLVPGPRPITLPIMKLTSRKDLTDAIHRVGETVTGSGSDRAKPQTQNGDSASGSGSDSATGHSTHHDRREAAASPWWKDQKDAIHRLGDKVTGSDRAKPNSQNGDSASGSGSDTASSHSTQHDRRDLPAVTDAVERRNAAPPGWKDLTDSIHRISQTIPSGDRAKPSSQNGDSASSPASDTASTHTSHHDKRSPSNTARNPDLEASTEPDAPLSKRVLLHIPAVVHRPGQFVGRRSAPLLARKEKSSGKDDDDDDDEDHPSDTPTNGSEANLHRPDAHGVHKKPGTGKGGKKDRRGGVVDEDVVSETNGVGFEARRVPVGPIEPVILRREAKKGVQKLPEGNGWQPGFLTGKGGVY